MVAKTSVKKLFRDLDMTDMAAAGAGAALVSYVPGKIIKPVVDDPLTTDVVEGMSGTNKALKILVAAGTAALAGVVVHGVTKSPKAAAAAVAGGIGMTIVQGLAMANVVQIGQPVRRQIRQPLRQQLNRQGIGYPNVPTDQAFSNVRLV